MARRQHPRAREAAVGGRATDRRGGIAWAFLGFPGFIGVFGAGLGILTWVQMASARKGTAA